jgi:tetratricopeptide (TPR) repeat protein
MNTLWPFHLTKTGLAGIVSIVLMSTSSSFAQNSRIDSLKQKLASTPEPESFEINFQLAREVSYFGNNVALDYARKANLLACLKQDSLDIVRSLRLMGQLYRRLDNLDSAVYYLQRCLQIAIRHNFEAERNTILNGLGIVYINRAKYDLALYYLLQSVSFYEKSDDKSMVALVENNLGLVYYKLNDFKMALEHYNKSLAIKIATKDNYDMDVLIIDISLCNVYLGNLEEARKRINSVLENCPTKCDDNIFLSSLFTSAVIWYKSDRLDKAESEFLKSYSIAKKSNNKRLLFDNIIYLSKIYLKRGNISATQKFLSEGERMTKESHFDLEEMSLYQQLCALYSAKGNYNKLSLYKEKYIQIKDSIYTQNQTSNLMRLHAEASEKGNKTQLASQEQTLQLKDQIINKQSLANILTGIAVVLLATLIHVLTKIFLRRREANYLLNKKVLERSDELLQNQQSLKIAIEQRDVALTRLSQDLSNSIESMRSLCSAGSEMEADSNARRYFNEINITTRNLSNSLSNILSESKVA